MPAIQGEVYVEKRAREPLAFALGEALDASVAVMRKRGVVLTLAQVIVVFPNTLLALAADKVFGSAPLFTRAYYEQTLALMAVGSVVNAVFRGGLTLMALDALRGKNPRVSDLLRGARFFLPMLAIEILHIVVLVLSAPFLFVPYVLVWMGLALTPYWIVDGSGFIASMRASWRASRGERWHLFGFYCATGVVGYLGLLACCVGTFPAGALVSIATAYVFTRLAGEDVQWGGADDDAAGAAGAAGGGGDAGTGRVAQ